MADMNYRYPILIFILSFVFVGCISIQPILSVEEQVLREQKIQGLLTQSVFYLRIGDERNIDRAGAVLMLAKKLKPEDPRVLDGLGAVEFRRRNLLKAQKYFQEAIRINPEYDRAYGHLALIAEANGDQLAANQLYRIALEKNPLNVEARKNYGLYLQKGSRGNIVMKKHADEELLMAEVMNGGGGRR